MFLNVCLNIILNGRASGSSTRGSKSTVMKRLAKSSETDSPLPVRMTKAEAFKRHHL